MHQTPGPLAANAQIHSWVVYLEDAIGACDALYLLEHTHVRLILTDYGAQYPIQLLIH